MAWTGGASPQRVFCARPLFAKRTLDVAVQRSQRRCRRGEAHLQFFSHLFDEGYDKAKEYAKNYMLGYIGHGGTFDYQRRAYAFGKDGFTQLPQFRDVSNFNVGLIFQQAGIPLEVTLDQAGEYARKHSSNYAPDKPYGIEPRTREFIELGYRVGASHVYDSRRRP